MKSVDPGILPQSCCFTMTPTDTARQLYFYPTWCGHYYCNSTYYMRRISYQYMLIVFIRKGTMHVEYRGESVDAHSFKKQVGIPPMEYVIQTRMERAKSLLISTGKSVAEIAYEVEYSSSGSFINQFVRKIGQSPKNYRYAHQPEN